MEHHIIRTFKNRTSKQFHDYVFSKYGTSHCTDIKGGGVHSGNIDFIITNQPEGITVDAVYTVPLNHWVIGIIASLILGFFSFGVLFIVGIIWIYVWAKVVMCNSAESEMNKLLDEFQNGDSKAAAAPPPPPPED